MKNLNDLALSLTKKNLVKKSKTTSMNDRLVELLKNGRKMTRIEIINEVTILRLKERYSEKDLEKLFESMTEEFINEFKKLNTTCKNGLDTSLANGHTNANFSYNEKYNKYEIIKDGNIISMITKK
jgi:hypothetical protein